MERGSRPDSNIVLLLSLKLILLAFFILLNALAEFEALRTEAVLKSVNQAFNGNLESAEDTPTNSASISVLSEAEDLVREFGSLFESLINAKRSKETGRATIMRIELPASSMFQAGRSKLSPGRAVLIRRLAEVLMRERTGLIYEVEILHGTAAPAKSADQPVSAVSRSIEARRVNALARRLLRKGLPAEKIAVSLLPGQPGIVQFVLRVHDRDKVSAEPAEGAE